VATPEKCPSRHQADPNLATGPEGQDHTVRETGEHCRIPTGSAAPWHMHPSAQQLLLVIAGALTVEVEAQGKTLLEAGEAVIIPADLLPTFADE
jgi:quercetin dioxygenase-like cupin family protein